MIYFAVIIAVALIFEQFITGVYNLTLQGIAGNINSYIFLVVIYIILFFIGKIFLDKKLHPRASQFILFSSFFHIGAMLALYFYSVEPMLLLIFPVIIVIAFWSRIKHPRAKSLHFKFRIIHPEFIDDRGGICVLRAGSRGFSLLKFFQVFPPLPIKELLLYLYHEQIEITFEVQGNKKDPDYYLTILHQGRNYDLAFKEIMDRCNRLKQFLKKEGAYFEDIYDIITVQQSFYRPYFTEAPFKVNIHGTPQNFPLLSTENGEFLIQKEFQDQSFSFFTLKPDFNPNELYHFLSQQEEPFHLQLHLRPLAQKEREMREEELNQQYRHSIKRLSDGLEDNAEFQAASYLFSHVGQSSKESIEPLLNKEELDRLNNIKEQIQNLKFGVKIGLWDLEISLLSSMVIAHAIRGRVGGSTILLPPQAVSALTSRSTLGNSQLVDSKRLSCVLPALACEPGLEIKPLSEPIIEEIS